MLSDCPPTLLFHSRVSRRKRHHYGYRTLALRNLWWPAPPYAPATTSDETSTSILQPQFAPAPTEALLTRGGSEAAARLSSGGWGGHRLMLSEMSQPVTGNGKEAMEDYADPTYSQDVHQPAPKRHAGPRHNGSSCQHPGGGSSTTGAAWTPARPLLRCEQDFMPQAVGSKRPDPLAANPTAATSTGMTSAKTTSRKVTEMDAMHIDTFDSVMPHTPFRSRSPLPSTRHRNPGAPPTHPHLFA